MNHWSIAGVQYQQLHIGRSLVRSLKLGRQRNLAYLRKQPGDSSKLSQRRLMLGYFLYQLFPGLKWKELGRLLGYTSHSSVYKGVHLLQFRLQYGDEKHVAEWQAFQQEIAKYTSLRLM